MTLWSRGLARQDFHLQEKVQHASRGLAKKEVHVQEEVQHANAQVISDFLFQGFLGRLVVVAFLFEFQKRSFTISLDACFQIFYSCFTLKLSFHFYWNLIPRTVFQVAGISTLLPPHSGHRRNTQNYDLEHGQMNPYQR